MGKLLGLINLPLRLALKVVTLPFTVASLITRLAFLGTVVGTIVLIVVVVILIT